MPDTNTVTERTGEEEALKQVGVRIGESLWKEVQHERIEHGFDPGQFLEEAYRLRLALLRGGKPALDRAVKALEQKG